MSDPAPKAIFLSYARDDAAAARRIAEALRAAGLEVWFDENELTGGDAWDQKIRTQIGECALFLPVISANTQARLEGYFRLEWRIAEQRSHLMAKGRRFLVPVCIDDTREKGAQVPDAFLEVQWTRVAAGAASPAFIDLVKRLLSPPSQAAGAAQPAATVPTSPPSSRGFPKWAIAVVAALALVVTYISYRAYSPANSTSRSPSPVVVEKSPPTSPPGSESQRLVAKARALYEPWDFASQEDFNLADELLRRAVALDPTDAEAWAHASILSSGFLALNYDQSDTRLEAARKQGERALKLSPDSNLARFAVAFSYRFNPATREESVRLLQIEAGRQSTNKMILRTLGNGLRATGRYEQALVYFDKALALPGGDPISLYCRALALVSLNRHTEAEVAVDEVLAQVPHYTRARLLKINMLIDQHGDLVQARAELEKIPAALQAEDNVASVAGRLWLYLREPERSLTALRGARNYLETGLYTGPKGYLTGLAYQLSKQPDAARNEWQLAMKVVEERLARDPNSTILISRKATLHAALGQESEADSLLRLLKQKQRGGEWLPMLTESRILLHLARNEAALVALEKEFASESYYSARIALRHEFLFDPLRSNPRFESLLKAMAPMLPRK